MAQQIYPGTFDDALVASEMAGKSSLYQDVTVPDEEGATFRQYLVSAIMDVESGNLIFEFVESFQVTDLDAVSTAAEVV